MSPFGLSDYRNNSLENESNPRTSSWEKEQRAQKAATIETYLLQDS